MPFFGKTLNIIEIPKNNDISQILLKYGRKIELQYLHAFNNIQGREKQAIEQLSPFNTTGITI